MRIHGCGADIADLLAQRANTRASREDGAGLPRHRPPPVRRHAALGRCTVHTRGAAGSRGRRRRRRRIRCRAGATLAPTFATPLPPGSRWAITTSLYTSTRRDVHAVMDGRTGSSESAPGRRNATRQQSNPQPIPRLDPQCTARREPLAGTFRVVPPDDGTACQWKAPAAVHATVASTLWTLCHGSFADADAGRARAAWQHEVETEPDATRDGSCAHTDAVVSSSLVGDGTPHVTAPCLPSRRRYG